MDALKRYSPLTQAFEGEGGREGRPLAGRIPRATRGNRTGKSGRRGRLAPVLPHHRTYRSVYGGSEYIHLTGHSSSDGGPLCLPPKPTRHTCFTSGFHPYFHQVSPLGALLPYIAYETTPDSCILFSPSPHLIGILWPLLTSASSTVHRYTGCRCGKFIPLAGDYLADLHG